MAHPFRDVAIVGIHNTRQAKVLEGHDSQSIALEAALGAVDDAGLSPRDIDGVVGGLASNFLYQSRIGPAWRSMSPLGIPAVPSDVDPAPLAGQDYFNGGFNTGRHGSSNAGPSDAIQVECHYTGLRDTAANRAGFADLFVTAVLAFLRDHYGWVPA